MDTYFHDCAYDHGAVADLPSWTLAQSGPEIAACLDHEPEHTEPQADAPEIAAELAEETGQERQPFARLSDEEEKEFSRTIRHLFARACRLVADKRQADIHLQDELAGWLASDGLPVPQKRRVRRLRQVVSGHCCWPAWQQEISDLLDRVDAAAAEIILGNLALVEIVALKFLGRGLAKADLVQEGTIGLIRAAYRFDAERARFATYAPFWIRQAMGKAVVDQARTIRLPSHLAEQRGRFLKFYYLMHNEQGRAPDDREVARRSGVSMRMVKRFKSLPPTTSLDAPVAENSNTCLGDFIAAGQVTAADSLNKKKTRQAMEQVFQELKPKEAQVLTMRYGLRGSGSLTLAEVGDRLGVSRERVRQIEKKALARLRHPVRRDKLALFL